MVDMNTTNLNLNFPFKRDIFLINKSPEKNLAGKLINRFAYKMCVSVCGMCLLKKVFGGSLRP